MKKLFFLPILSISCLFLLSLTSCELLETEEKEENSAAYGPHPGGSNLPDELKGSWSTTTISLANAWNQGQFVKAIGVSGAITLVFKDDNKVERYWYTENRPSTYYSIYGASKETGRVKVGTDGRLTLIWAKGEWEKTTAPSANSTDGHFTYSDEELTNRTKTYLGYELGTSSRNIPEIRLVNESGTISYMEKM
ncbi:hypothetical protein AHMF7605_22320 [Adhaeribacter arboris]|uniref:Lipocalin-like domain-containing protein n=1 Tax=Adhaeribacter arboris TaxID=2072846 RepID=A0A2T2YKJ9_9BACT|nr:hypothetical protein [Adhaeribacter arboris]PSR56037.1 hypothetical protein AHMF7605_22320 [Adhaeribacter arboris]